MFAWFNIAVRYTALCFMMYVSMAALIFGWILVARIAIGGRGAHVDPVVRPDTTVGVAPPDDVAIDCTGTTVVEPRTEAPPDSDCSPGTCPGGYHAAGKDPLRMGIPSRTFEIMDVNWLRGYWMSSG